MTPEKSASVRLFVAEPLAAGGRVTVSGTPAHYLLNVMRRGIGDAIALFNGTDGEWRAEIEKVSRKSVSVALGERTRAQDPMPPAQLLFAPVKRSAVDLIAEKATELDAGLLRPVISRFTQSARVNVERMRKIAIEAAEQCGRTTVPEIHPPAALAQVLADWPEHQPLIHFDETGSGGKILDLAGILPKADIGYGILIGPEGGFDKSELDALANLSFVTPVTLGKRILRAETAAIAGLVCCRAVLDGQA